MSRLRSALVYPALWFVLLNSINSIKYRIIYEPTKIFQPCKNTQIKPVQDFIDISNLSFIVADDANIIVKGTIHSIIDVPKVPVVMCDVDYNFLQMVTTFKQKLRGRWIDVPYTYRINDLCQDYFKEGAWWYDKITKYFVGDQRVCPALKSVRLPINYAADITLTMPAPLPEGEYVARSIAHFGNFETCMDNYGELRQA